MPAQPTNPLVLDHIVETQCLVDGVYQCSLLDPQINAAIQELDDAATTSSSALGHSATVDEATIRAKLDRLLAAKQLCLARKTSAEAGDTALETAAAQPAQSAKAVGFDFSGRQIE